MLKPVIENEESCTVLSHGLLRNRCSIGTLQMRDAGKVLRQHLRFVVRAVQRSVATAKNGGARAMILKIAGEILNAGRLAGPADGQIADADDRDGRTMGADPAAIISAVTQTNGPGIRHARRG